ncbi:MAG TPA: 30S ribosomal protein S5 [Patescibacteria group bacterium]|nr:30S ribosomal protein S5 [Patescibacteria group bacterium]
MVETAVTTPTVERSDRTVKNIMRPRSFGSRREPSEFEERVIEVRRVARTVKGGRRIRFRALVVIGNKKGKVGMGIAKANDVAEAVKKAVAQAKKSLVVVPIIDGTIPYNVISKHGGAVVMLKPAASGTSIVAGGAVRAIAELAGITDLLSKMMGSSSKVNNITAMLKAFTSFNPEYTEKVQKYADNKSKLAKTAVEAVELKVEKDKVKSEKIEAEVKPEKVENVEVKEKTKPVTKKTVKKEMKAKK